MKYKSIFNVCLLTAFLLTATTSCDDWTEMEIHETDVNGAKEQTPEQYAVYTQNLRAYKATKHAVVYARLDNAPDKATSEKFFLRSLPDTGKTWRWYVPITERECFIMWIARRETN